MKVILKNIFIDEKRLNNHIKKRSELPFHEIKQELSLNDLLWVFDAVSLYPTAMVDEKSI